MKGRGKYSPKAACKREREFLRGTGGHPKSRRRPILQRVKPTAQRDKGKGQRDKTNELGEKIEMIANNRNKESAVVTGRHADHRQIK